MNLFKEESDEVKKLFDLDEIIKFQKLNDIQIIRGSDYLYECFINKKVYTASLTFLGALIYGIYFYKEQNK